MRLLAPQARLGLSGVTVRTPGGNQILAEVGVPFIHVNLLLPIKVCGGQPGGLAVVAGSFAAAERQPAASQAMQ